MRHLFDNRQLSKVQAKAIADSQTDLGGKSKEDMVIALAGLVVPLTVNSWDRLVDIRMEAYERLDPISQFIVKTYLEGSLEDAYDYFNYAIKSLQEAQAAIQE